MKPGDLVKFVHAPSRWSSEPPREPVGLLGKTGIIVAYSHDDAHQWGGIWQLMVEGHEVDYWGDFLEVISESG